MHDKTRRNNWDRIGTKNEQPQESVLWAKDHEKLTQNLTGFLTECGIKKLLICTGTDVHDKTRRINWDRIGAKNEQP